MTIKSEKFRIDEFVDILPVSCINMRPFQIKRGAGKIVIRLTECKKYQSKAMMCEVPSKYISRFIL